MVQSLHDERHPGQSTLNPNQLELGKALWQTIDDPVSKVNQVVVYEGYGVHRYESVEL